MEEKIKEIKDRWSDMSPKPYCESWMYEVIRHGDRNMDIYCEGPEENSNEHYEEVPHPDRYDGEIFAYASHDIHILLNIIDDQKKVIQDQYEKIKQILLEVSLMPGGQEYLKAQDHFENLKL